MRGMGREGNWRGARGRNNSEGFVKGENVQKRGERRLREGEAVGVRENV